MHCEKKIGEGGKERARYHGRRMVEHTLKDSKVEMAERVFHRGENEGGGDGSDTERHSLINPKKLSI